MKAQKRKNRTAEDMDRELSNAIQDRTGLPASVAWLAGTAAAAHLRAVAGGCTIYVPVRAPVPVDALRAGFQAGKSMRELCRHFGVSRSTGYRWLQAATVEALDQKPWRARRVGD